MRLLTKGNLQARNLPGEWFAINGVIFINCPECKTSRRIINHRIETDGIVKPAMECLLRKCSWRENVKLDGWDRGIQPGSLPEETKAGTSVCPHSIPTDRACPDCRACLHVWEVRKVGGDPAEASSYELVKVCEKCGEEFDEDRHTE